MRNKNNYEDYILGTSEEQINRGKDFYAEKIRRDGYAFKGSPYCITKNLHKFQDKAAS